MMKLNIILIFALCGSLSVCVGQIVQDGQCDPNIPLVADFDFDRFVGTWYEIHRSDSPEQNADCASFEITASSNTINVYHSGVNNNFQEDSTGTATMTAGTARVTLDITMFDTHQRATSRYEREAMDFWVLLTDYNNFAVTYSCENISATQRSVYLWVLGRARAFPNDLMPAHIDTNLGSLLGVSLSNLQTIDHSDTACYVLPVIEPGQSIILPGQCDLNIPVQQNFDVAAFTGTWHQIASYYTESSTGSCARAEYSVGDGVVNVLNSQVINQALLTITGTASVISTDNSAKLSVSLEVAPNIFVEQDLWILGTDYTNYAISYSCENISSNERRIYSWILSRTRQLSTTGQAGVDQIIQSVVELNSQYYIETDQSAEGCFYFPEPSDQPVRFRGQCDLSIPAMPNFDAERYMGTWHNIELYPALFQDGTCSNAFYELNGGVVEVFNTQVISETLDTIRGTGVIASTDGSAKLLVTFPIAGTDFTITTDYWVLDTDYSSYALVYSCSNINDDYMQVGSWKLSRTKQLTNAANTAINSKMSTIPVLDQRYFKPVDQSVAGCFYFPTPQAGVPVVFPGQCDATIGMQTFNLAQFQGTWHEVQAYPKEEQTGQCINHMYTIASNTQLNLVSSSVVDQFLTLTNGVLTATDTSGRLTITITTNNGPITIPFWIVNTDYTNYALAYACVNQGTDFRAVWSWKLSRTQALSAASETAINTAIANIDVLDNRYYENIDQSEQACSYLPVIEPGQPIILSGQCDTNVRPIDNFNTAQFSGRWRLMRSYPSDSQIGTCNIVDYTQVNVRTLTANHAQVVSQTLTSTIATVISTDGSGRLQFTSDSTQAFEYLVLGTDYDSYALLYSCQNLGATQRRVWSWILSRDESLSDSANTNINQIINANEVLNNRYYEDEDRSNTGCFYYPEVNPSSAVRFRGECDMNIPVVQNFDAVAYMGLWHDIESYPDPFQDGTCNNAFYTLIDGVVDVFNTQVIGQTLDTIRGSAVITSTDGSAKLDATFNIAGMDVTTKYWVLATDYTSYSYVYSCRPVDDEYVQVTSWKLSRTKTLSAAANTAINNVMNTIPVLDQRYYVTRDHSEAGCFYFPEPQLNVPVVFPGQCDNNIATVQNFDFSQFQGTWYEIEAYPKDEQSGQCINHVYSFISSTQLNLVSSSITSQIQTLSNSIVTGNGGRLNIAIVSGGQTINIPFWIISTDYNNYALAYACVNQGNDYRGIWSWKLSRTKQLSTASVTAINNALATINVLDNRYYETIDQSDQACFYLPDLEDGEPVVLPGQCDTNIRGVANFSPSRYQGRWRVVQSYAADSQIGTCNVARYSLRDALSLNVVHTEVVNQSLRSISGTATVSSSDASGRLQFSFPSSNAPSEHIILDTDYDSYAFVYGCENVGSEQRRVWSWKLSRDLTLSQVANNNINQIINNIDVLNARYYYNVDLSDAGCFYYPEVDTSTAVRFRGQCDMNIPVVQNFDAVAYMGLWHDIESYPDPFQDGTCNNAFYTLIDGVVDVFNTQVIGQTLDTIRGSAVITSTDGSAKLDATFNIAGMDVTTKYWVLATDYTSYSYVYSCRAIDDEFVQVTSWKLSRTKTLPAAANTAINSVMNTIPVLDQRYYVTRDHSEAGCFYFPDPQPNVPVVFPGQCDNNIATVQNFDFSQFQGTWYEIEAYPKDEQSGQCINHAYSFISNTQLNLVSSSISNQIRTLSDGVVTGNNGRLNIAIVSGGQTISIPFWILSTDYNNYALAYACVNQGNDFRGIWSWKLSRSKQLSTASATAINNVIADIDVVDNRYFEPIDQSDQACFYLPEIAAGQPVIFPGQCDTSIRGVNNFTPNRFEGRWRLIQSYGSDSQVGTCNVARYTLRDALSLNVDHSEVVSQSLRSISGTATVSSNDSTGSLQISFPSNIQPSEHIILATDYDSYAFVYGCENIGTEERRVWSWKLSRDTTLSQNANDNINQIINGIDVLNARYYYNIDHSEAGCFYFPESDLNSDVVFRGQCNQNIPVVQNFDAIRYMGLWHDIESYPMAFQFGTCPNALYNLVGGVVDVFNTQVINQTLDTINGTAVIVSTDGSAKLAVTFNVFGIDLTTDYWVLSTDYDNYALVYSCRNIDDEFMSVYSWKLSRTRSLTAAANTQINTVMNTLDVLDSRYFVNRDQTNEGCFYYPEPESDTPVVFPGQCDDSIQAMPLFNVNSFAGVWHETAAYPYSPSGQCVNHQFIMGSSQALFTLTSSNVVNETFSSTNRPMTLTGSDGRFTVTIETDGQTRTVPVWILTTDYTDFALAYSCVNIDSLTRQVYSWKLSRTKQPTANGIAAINAAMANIDVLDERYFETGQQSDEACFYLPDISTNEPVTFPGQCDQNIPVIRNFDAGRYLGRWRLIQTYYAEFQLGTCSEANYSAASDGSVIVFNTEVVNQQLETITGSAIVASIDGSGKLNVTFPTSTTASEYWILDTDYDSYALVYSCENLSNDRRRVWSWKMSRTNSLTAAANVAINQIVDSINVLNDRYYSTIDRSDAACFYYPTPNANAPVVFRGQCDMTIPAVPNFDPTRYTGLWYDIASYPAPFQTGTCSKANYALNADGSVYVENTQVVDQILETWIGSAVVATDDGTAKLNVTFNINGFDATSKYWVLSTDYDTYALVYSCTEIDEETRGVFSWKLSRTPALTAAANTAINNVINTVQVLDQQYYVERGHTEDDCFYYPDNNGGDVLLPGQCLADNQVPAVTNFNANLFAGTWHEISRFPSSVQRGECVSTEYLLSGTNAFTVSQSTVNDERLWNTVTAATVANDGRGVISATIDGVPFNNVFILATDYNEYAVAYSCRNVDTETKQIYSWKLSRSRSGFSAAANTVINQLVSDNIDLWEGYYRTTGQDNNACFYYPAFEQLPPSIELPGPCPDSVRGVPNFDAAAYLGRWFETARYPMQDQAGQCSRAEYSLEDRVVVYNTEVIDQTLQIQTGFADVASTDGSGVLNVEFVVNGMMLTANYYIVATDYTSYSLVYSCANTTNGNSRVSSWKLSRTPTMSAQSAAAIVPAIISTQGLTEEYYQTTSQTDEDCFYIPSVNISEAPVFRGQCESITGIQGFDAERYLGWWHEIERYPIDGAGGECRSTEYSQDGNTYRVVDTQVENNAGTVATGTVTITNDGRLRRTISGRPDQDIWVLATDYDTYALLYSCENINAEYRAVWSAKHSKSRSLTESAQNAMAPLIANNRVLYEQFYVNVDQTASTCFHYPTTTGEQVIIPGQCDSSIPVVANFNAEEFAGTWYQTERYDEVEGSCVASRYTVDEESGNITVRNYEVRDDEILTEEGSARIVSTDGSATIEFTLPVAGSEDVTFTTSVSILATDYTSYALVYNCVNINAYQRQVRAWKLSRDRTLSTEGTTAINNLIQQRQELHQPYFKQIEQNDECPEPSSALIIKSSIIVLLICAMLQWLL